MALAIEHAHDQAVRRADQRVDAPRDRARRWTVLRYIGWGLVLVVVGAGARFAWWLGHAPQADPAAYAAVTRDPTMQVQARDSFLVLRPTRTTPEVGILFHPGARIEPAAYVAKLAGIARAANAQIVIGRPPLGLAVFAIGQADEMRATAPEISRWYVAGHSLGGAAACMYARRHATQLEGILLFGTYCGSDISRSGLRVLSVTGTRDGLFPPADIRAARHELPATARLVEIAGMNHGQFGNYGPQDGDLAPRITDVDAGRMLASSVAAFLRDGGHGAAASSARR